MHPTQHHLPTQPVGLGCIFTNQGLGHRKIGFGMVSLHCRRIDQRLARSRLNLGKAASVVPGKHSLPGLARRLRQSSFATCAWQFSITAGRSENDFASFDERRIHRLGNVHLQEKYDALAACTLLCVPSIQESFGGIYTEAWSFGKLVIGGNIPAIAEVITDGVDGYLVKQDPKEIADLKLNRYGTELTKYRILLFGKISNYFVHNLFKIESIIS